MRVGIGYDSHRFSEDPDRGLILGGVRIPDHPGLSGHSDADAATHAVTDAVLGAAGLGDIGTHFPPSDPQWENADSIALLEEVVALVAREGYMVGNVDITLVCETPRIGPHAQDMRERLAAALAIKARSVSIKGKSNEGMGWIGRGEGIAAIAVALIVPAE